MFYLTHSRAWCAPCLVLIIFSIRISSAQVNVSFAIGTKQTLQKDWFGYDGQNVIRGVSWVDTNLTASVPLIKPQILRYPSTFSFWDWKVGWFVDSPLLPAKYAALQPQPNYLENFKIVLDSCDADALFTL